MCLDQRDGVLWQAQTIKLAFPAKYLGLKRIFKTQETPRFGRLAGTYLRQYLRFSDQAFDQHLDLSPALLLAEQSGMQDTGIVHYQQIAR